ncbi:MAG TPA: glycosyltransferase family 4 protein [Dehalococcoidia bacterium]|nr:glycosyltransferase family 4 protein [Dehalococcoidia bacterium]
MDPVFVETLENALNVGADVLSIDTTRGKRGWRLYRHITYAVLAVRALLKQRRYRYTVFWQLFTGLYFTPLARLTLPKGGDSLRIALHLIYKPRPGRLGRLYRELFAALLDTPDIDAFICHTSREAELYVAEFGAHLRKKLRYVEYGVGRSTNVTAGRFDASAAPVFFAGGTSNRDYATLVEAFRGRAEQLRIFCFERDVAALDLPDNVTVVSGVFDDAFAAAMRATDGVIVTLDNPSIASGHLVLLEAMRQGKPIIATRGSCTSDLLDDSCAVRVDPHSTKAVREALDELRDDVSWAQAMALNGRRRFESHFTVERYGERIAEQLIALRAEKTSRHQDHRTAFLTGTANGSSPHAHDTGGN